MAKVENSSRQRDSDGKEETCYLESLRLRDKPTLRWEFDPLILWERCVFLFEVFFMEDPPLVFCECALCREDRMNWWKQNQRRGKGS